MSSILQGGQSSLIEMTMKVNGKTYKVTHSAPDHLILADSIHLEPCQATLVVSIDGEVTAYPFEVKSVVDGHRVEAQLADPRASQVA